MSGLSRSVRLLRLRVRANGNGNGVPIVNLISPSQYAPQTQILSRTIAPRCWICTSTSTYPFLRGWRQGANARRSFRGHDQMEEDEVYPHERPPAQQADNERLITVPLALKKRLEKKMERESTERHRKMQIVHASRKGKSTQVLINCKNKELNHYLGGSYPKNADVPLASKGWCHYKSAGDHFIIRPAPQTAAFGFREGIEPTFEELGVQEKLVERLKENKALKPTLIQELAIKSILKGGNNLVAAETGCGKTLAYLIPLVQQILLEKRRRRKRGVNQPLAIILVPSHELAKQIFLVAVALTRGLGVELKILMGGNLGMKIANPPCAHIDLLISTVHCLTTLSTTGVYNISRVDHLVLDEADTLLDDSFSSGVTEFLRRFPFSPSADRVTQITLVSATLPKTVEDTLQEILPLHSLNYISTPSLHYVMSHVPQTFLRLKKSQKPEKLLEILKADMEKKIPVMVFCNKTKTCDWMGYFLEDNGLPCIRVHGEVRPALRKGLLDQYQNGEADILVTTDLGSRGINTIRTGHVVNYDFPSFVADYIHRCGRTGRVGSQIPGKVTNFITGGKGEVFVVKEIELSIREESKISKVDANIKRLYSSKYGTYSPVIGEEEESDDENI